jgi:aspartate carbamoyltransferase catalytic subunit
MNHLSVNNLTGIRGLTENDLELIFQAATEFKEVINRPIKKVPSLRDYTVANLFLKTQHERDYHLNWRKND